MFGVALTTVLLLHGLFAFIHHPYYFTYYNPLVGGSRVAPHVLFVGWGEGLDAVAAWLKQQPEAASARGFLVQRRPAELLFAARTESAVLFSPISWSTPITSCSTRINGSGACLTGAGQPFPSAKPAHIVRSGGLELARIYDVRNETPPAFLQIDTANAADFGDRMRLAGYRLEQESLAPGDRAEITLYLRRLADADVAYNVLLRLVAPDGAEVWRDEGWPAGDRPPIGLSRTWLDDHQMVIPADAAPGRYRLMLSFYDPKNAELLPVAGGRVSHEVASLEVGVPGTGAPARSFRRRGRMGKLARLVSPRMRSSRSAQAGTTFN